MLSHRKGFTLHSLVSFIVIVAVLLTLILSAVVGHQSNKNSLIINSLEFNRINAEKLALAANDLLLSAKKTLSLSAQYIAGQEFSEVQRHLDLLRQSNNMFNSVFITDTNGVVVNTSPEALGIVGRQLTSDASQEALALKKPLVSEPYISLTGRYIILVSVPVFDMAGKYKGFLGGSIYLNESNVFETILGTQTINNSGSYFFVVSSKGELLYHPIKERIGDNALQNEVIQLVIGGETGEKQVRNTQGVDMLAGFAPVPESNWGIVAQTPLATITSSAQQLVYNMLLYSVPLIIILLALVVVFTRFISMPLYKLATFAENLTDSHQPQAQIPTIHPWNYEANELHKTMEKAVSSLRLQINELSVEAQKDKLTGLNNRRTMDKMLELWVQTQKSFSYIILDIDHFKSVNDTYGHPMGDEVLIFLAQRLLSHTGEEEVCFRYGGEEFVILTPTDDVDAACALIETIRKDIEQTDSPIGRPITISAGVTSAGRASNELQLIKQKADEALYHSKQTGRNKVSIG